MERCKNPQIAEITTTYKKRVFNLSDIRLPQGVYKKCVWCLGPLKGAQRRWCGDDCLNEASAWGNPQKEYGLGVLLIRQNFKCNICAYDWGAIVEGIYAGEAKRPYGWVEAKDTWRFKFNFWLAKKLKYVMAKTDKDRRLEVDHILAISKGGQSVGLGNHQAICHLCHKEKTKVDNSGPRGKRVVDPVAARRRLVQRQIIKIYEKMGEYHKGLTGLRFGTPEYDNYLDGFYDTISLEEMDYLIEYEINDSDHKKKLIDRRQKKLDKSDMVGDTEKDSNLTQGRSYDQENTVQLSNDPINDDSHEPEPGKPMGPIHD